MYTDELYKRQMGFRYDPDHLRSEVAGGGLVGYDGEFDRSNGFENDLEPGELPYRLFDEMGEVGEKAAGYMQHRVQEDMTEFGAKQMSNVEFALDRALIAYGIELADTPVHLEVSVAEYFGALANAILESKSINLTDEEAETLFADIASRLSALDREVADALATV